MTNEEALKRFKETYEMTKDYYDPHWEGSEYREHREWVEQLECAIKALKKQISKKPFRHLEDDDEEWYDCPTCGRALSLGFKKIIDHKYEYCLYCGQCIDWSDENETISKV